MLQPTLQYISLLLLLWSRNCCAPQKKKTERGGCCGAQCIMGRTIKIAVVFTQHGVGLVRSASRGLTGLNVGVFNIWDTSFCIS